MMSEVGIVRHIIHIENILSCPGTIQIILYEKKYSAVLAMEYLLCDGGPPASKFVECYFL
jgi:hypothetical protein